MFGKVQAWLEKLVGPNAAHAIDAGLALAIAAAIAFCSSPFARASLGHPALLEALVGLGVLLGTPLISKFRKAAGSQASLVDELAKLVEQTIVARDVKTAKMVTDAVAAASTPPEPPAA